METPTLTAERLRALAELYEQGQVSDLIERTLAKLLSHEANACQVQLRQLQADLREFEQEQSLHSHTWDIPLPERLDNRISTLDHGEERITGQEKSNL